MSTSKIWLHSIISAFVGGGASAFLSVLSLGWVIPDKVNSGAGLHTAFVILGIQFLLGGTISVVMFLKQSPVPEGWDGKERRDQAK